MTEEKQPMKTDKIMGLLSLILAIILSLNFLRTIIGTMDDVIYMAMVFLGRADGHKVGRTLGHLLVAALIVYCIIKLFKYSAIKLSKADKDEEDQVTNETD